MSPEFKSFHDQVVRMQQHFHDVVDNPEAASAQRIRSELQQLEDMVQLSKNPRSIEGAIKQLAEEILQAQHSQEPIMDPAHSTELYRLMEQLRGGARHLSHY